LADVAFFAGLAFFPDLPLAGATCAPRLPALAFLVALGCSASGARAVSVASAFVIIVFYPFCGVSAIT
jgi:hypothetical protein